MNTKHTPGPWAIRARSPHADHPVHVVEEGTSDVVCELSGSAPSDTVNARLIAAAPEMLAALKRVRDLIYAETVGQNEPQNIRVLAQIETALGKVEGRYK